MQTVTQVFKALFVWMGVPQISIDQVLGYEEQKCLCRDPKCQGVKARLAAEFHLVKNADGQLAAEPVRSSIVRPAG